MCAVPVVLPRKKSFAVHAVQARLRIDRRYWKRPMRVYRRERLLVFDADMLPASVYLCCCFAVSGSRAVRAALSAGRLWRKGCSPTPDVCLILRLARYVRGYRWRLAGGCTVVVAMLHACAAALVVCGCMDFVKGVGAWTRG